MLTIDILNSFGHDIKKLKKRGYDLKPLWEAVKIIQSGEKLPPRYRDHPLIGNWKSHRDCHIKGDWILIYAIFKDENILQLVRTGTHDDLGIE